MGRDSHVRTILALAVLTVPTVLTVLTAHCTLLTVLTVLAVLTVSPACILRPFTTSKWGKRSDSTQLALCTPVIVSIITTLSSFRRVEACPTQEQCVCVCVCVLHQSNVCGCSASVFWCLGILKASRLITRFPRNVQCACVCVCVKERERERA
jgi:hypothetical protein